MKYFVGRVTINNGHFDRSFQVQVAANNFKVGTARAVSFAIQRFRDLPSLKGKRAHIHSVGMNIMAGGKLPEDKSLVKTYCTLIN